MRVRPRLTYIPRDGRLMNQYAAEHTQAVASGVPILALDMYEHAYHIDFGANAKAYAETFVRNVEWKSVEGAYEDATWRDPERLQDWIGDLSKEKPVVVYCVDGFHVGCRTAGALCEAGFDAKYMTGGHSGWKAMGGPIKMKA